MYFSISMLCRSCNFRNKQIHTFIMNRYTFVDPVFKLYQTCDVLSLLHYGVIKRAMFCHYFTTELSNVRCFVITSLRSYKTCDVLSLLHYGVIKRAMFCNFFSTELSNVRYFVISSLRSYQTRDIL